MDVAGEYVYIADGTSGLQILPIHCDLTEAVFEDRSSASPPLMRIGPNPSAGPMAIRFDAPPHDRLRVAIYTPDGRLVRGLFNGILNSDSSGLLWDGRDDEGRQVATGIYHLRATEARGARTERVAILR